MPKTRRDLYYAMCDKLVGDRGQILRSHIEKLSALGNTGGLTGKFNTRLEEELSDEEYTAALQKSETTLHHMAEWEKLPPAEMWDRRN